MRVLIVSKPEHLECHLTDAEFVARATNLGVVCQDIEREYDRQSQIKADMKAQLARLEAERSRLTLIVTRKAEPREVKVTVYADDDAGEALTIREDTGEIIRRRPMDPKERQLPLPGVGAEPTADMESPTHYAARRMREIHEDFVAAQPDGTSVTLSVGKESVTVSNAEIAAVKARRNRAAAKRRSRAER